MAVDPMHANVGVVTSRLTPGARALAAALVLACLAGTASDAHGPGLSVEQLTGWRPGVSDDLTGPTRPAGPLQPLSPIVRSPSAQQAARATAQGAPLTYILAEGATGPFFDMDVAIVNPNGQKAPVEVRFLRANAVPILKNVVIPARARRTIRVNEVSGLANAEVSTVVVSLSGLPLVVERAMFWNRSLHYGGHGGSAVSHPTTTWYFAEGSQGFFDTYVLLANAQAVPAHVTIRFLTEREGVVTRRFTVDPSSRQTVWAGWFAELVNRSFSFVVTSDVPIVAERAMYFNGARIWEGGHGSAGVPAPATNWFHAEGATGPYFDLWLLLGNPNDQAAEVTITYVLENQSIDRHITIPGNSRRTTYVAWEDPRLREAAVSMVVTSNIPIVSERAMYWPRGRWHEAHNSAGMTSSGVSWGLAEGRVGGPRGYETYVLVSNASTTETAEIDVSFLVEDGPAIVRTFTVQPKTRFNIVAADHLPSTIATSANFGTVIRALNGVPVAAEMAMYWNASDAHGAPLSWAGGLNVTATELPPSGGVCDPVIEQQARQAGEEAARWLEGANQAPLFGRAAPLGARHLRHFLGGSGHYLAWSDAPVAGLSLSPAQLVRSTPQYQTMHAGLKAALQAFVQSQHQQGVPMTAGAVVEFIESQPLALSGFFDDISPLSNLYWAYNGIESVRVTATNVQVTPGGVSASITYELNDTYDVHDWHAGQGSLPPEFALQQMLYLQNNCTSVRAYSQALSVPDALTASRQVPNVSGRWRVTRVGSHPWITRYSTFIATLVQSGTQLSGTLQPLGLSAIPLEPRASHVLPDGRVMFGTESPYNRVWNDHTDGYFILEIDPSATRMTGVCNLTWTCTSAVAERLP